MLRRAIRANLWREIDDTLSPPILAWRLAVRVVCGLSSANMLPCARRICRQKLLGNPKCPRRADNLLSYISFHTSKNDFARQCDRRILLILTAFRVGQGGRRSDVSSCTLRSRVLNRQILCPIMHSLTLFACSLEFRRTLKIIARILREVVNRVKLCGHHTVRCSHVEVQSHVVVRRRGKLETRMLLRPPSPPRP